MKKLFALGLISFLSLSAIPVSAQNTSLDLTNNPIEVEFIEDDNTPQEITFFDVRHTGTAFNRTFHTSTNVHGTNLNIFVQNNTPNPINFIVEGFGTTVVHGHSSSTRSFANATNRTFVVNVNSPNGAHMDINARARQF